MPNRELLTDQSDPLPDQLDGDASAMKEPVCVILVGRGNRGKTHLCRWLAETAINEGRPVILADGDCTNQTLSGFFAGATTSPPSAHPGTVQTWFESTVQAAATQKSSVIFDFGAGDQTLKSISRELNLVDAIASAGLRPVALYCMSADPDDLSAVISSRESYAPSATIVALTTFNLPGHVSLADALSDLGSRDARLGALLEKGAELVTVPTLACTYRLSQMRLGFADAEMGHGAEVLGPFDRQRLAMWRRAMHDALQPVSLCLP